MQPLYNCAETYIQVSLDSDLFIGKECVTGRRSFALCRYGGPKLCDRGGRLLGIVKILHKRHSHSCDRLSKSMSKTYLKAVVTFSMSQRTVLSFASSILHSHLPFAEWMCSVPIARTVLLVPRTAILLPNH